MTKDECIKLIDDELKKEHDIQKLIFFYIFISKTNEG